MRTRGRSEKETHVTAAHLVVFPVENVAVLRGEKKREAPDGHQVVVAGLVVWFELTSELEARLFGDVVVALGLLNTQTFA